MRHILQRFLFGCLVLLLLPSRALATHITQTDAYYSDTNLIVTDDNESEDADSQYITTDSPDDTGDADVSMAGDADEDSKSSVSFTDVPADSWFSSYVFDLAARGIIGGFEDGTYRPNNEVTYAQALKMIMVAAGYDEQSPSGNHWASGYLTCAVSEGLISDAAINLDQNISRYIVAEIAAKALKLPLRTDDSPFSDMPTSVSSAPYVLALYQTGIILGNTSPSGNLVYSGDSFIKRSEIAAIIWRINNYRNNN